MIGILGYRCEVVARIPHRDRNICLGTYGSASPEFALGWLRSQAARIANALSPQPGIGPIPQEALHPVSDDVPNPGHIFRTWMWDFDAQDRKLAALKSGRPIGVQAGDLGAIYVLAAEPIFAPTETSATLELTAVV